MTKIESNTNPTCKPLFEWHPVIDHTFDLLQIFNACEKADK